MRMIGLAVTAVVIAGGLSASPAQGVATRYAAPGGSGSDCTALAACQLTEAIGGAHTGDTVQLAAGDYHLKAALSLGKSDLTITGPEGAAGARIIFDEASQGGAADDASKIVVWGQRVSLLKLTISGRTDGAHSLISRGANVTETRIDRARIENTGTGITVAMSDGSLRNSVVKQTGATGIAAVTMAGTIVGSTLYSRAGDALLASDGWMGGDCTVTILNSMLWGGESNLKTQNVSAPCPAVTVSYDYSWIPDPGGPGFGGGIKKGNDTTVTAGTHNLARAAAVFNPENATNTYLSTLTLPPRSPAINAGCTLLCGDYDYFGRPRPIGSANDIGPMEQSLNPALSDISVAALTPTSALLSATLNARGDAANYTVDLRTSGGSWKTLGDGISADLFTAAPVSATATGLSPGTAYDVRVRATNSRGSATPLNASFATAATPPPGPDPQPTPAPAVSVTQLRAKVTKRKARLLSVVTTTTSGVLSQTASARKKTRCRVQVKAASASSYTLRCPLRKKTSAQLRRHKLKFTVVTALHSGSQSATVTSTLKVPRLTSR